MSRMLTVGGECSRVSRENWRSPGRSWSGDPAYENEWRKEPGLHDVADKKRCLDVGHDQVG